MIKNKAIFLWKVAVATCFSVSLAHAFVIKKIDIVGLHKVQKQTVVQSLPIKIGDEYTANKSKTIIHALYEMGFFDDIQLSQKNTTLVINIKERPTIAWIKVEGNKDVTKTQIQKIFADTGLIRGRMLNRAILDRFKAMLITQYRSRGKLNIKVDVIITPKSQNRVDVKIVVNEGKPTIIKKITFVGNKKFSSRALRKTLKISTPGLLTFFTETHKYSKEKLDESLYALREYYLERGYINFRVVDSEVKDIPGENQVHVTIEVSEGSLYKVKDYFFVGNTILPREKLVKQTTFEKGDTFSRRETLKTRANINDLLADQGYTYSVVDVQPEIIEASKEVNLNFVINPGRSMYVRKIIFTGNHKTADYVLRRAFRQEEGSLLSHSRVQESLRQIRLLEYIDSVDVEHRPVEGVNNEVDLLVKVEEGQIATIQASVGYGTLGVEFDAGVNNKNLFGTGRSGSFQFKNDTWGNIYSLSEYNPFFSKSGIGNGVRLYFQEYKPGKSKTSKLSIDKLKISSFATNKMGINTDFNVPLSDQASLNFGLGAEFLHIIKIGAKNGVTPTQLQNYVDKYGTYYRQGRVTAGWDRMGYDQLPFPTKGMKNSIDALMTFPLGNKGVSYYKLGVTNKIYTPLFFGFILTSSAGVHYGNGFNGLKILPFFENYYAGGMSAPGSVRGFGAASLGPKDSNKDQLGGNFLLHGNASLILPKPLSRDNIRFYVFLDAGNVYQTSKDTRFTGTKSGPIRFSTGIAMEWRTPFGPLNFSVGFPLNKRKNDEDQIFAFDMRHGFA